MTAPVRDHGKGRAAQGAGGRRRDQLYRDAGYGRAGARVDQWPRRRLRRRDRRTGNDRESLKALAVGGHVSLIAASLSPAGTMLHRLLLTGRRVTVGAISVGSRAAVE